MNITSLLFIFIALFLVGLAGNGINRRIPVIAPILAIAFVLRLGAAVFHHLIHPLPDSTVDAVRFERVGWEWSQEGWSEVLSNFGLGAETYQWIISIVYLLVGRDPFAVQLINVTLGTAIVLLVFLSTQVLWGNPAARTVAWAAALWPALILYSAIPLREAWFLAFFALAMYGTTLWITRGSKRISSAGFAIAVAGLGAASAFHGGAVAALLLLLLWAFMRVASTIKAKESEATWRAAEAGSLLGMIILAVMMLPDPLATAGGARMFTLEMIAKRQSYADWADSGYLQGLIAQSWFDVFWQTPVRMFYFLYSPLPWDIEKATYLVGMLDGFLYLGLTLALVRSWPVLKERRVTWFLILLLALLLVIFALNTYNAGTALRHRAKLAPLFLMLVPAIAHLPQRVPRARRLLFVVNDPAPFFPNRHNLALSAKAEGWEVHVAGPAGEGVARIEEAGWPYHHIRMDRRNLRPFRELPTVLSLILTLRRVRPQIVHAIALKPLLHAGLAARLTRTPGFVGTVTGLGYLFIQSTVKARLFRPILATLLGMALDHRRGVCIFQNEDDLTVFLSLGIVEKTRTQLIRGSGVDPDQFAPAPLPGGALTFVLCGRMLVDKGVGEFVEAARIALAAGLDARFALAGYTDPGNPAAISPERLDAWQAEGAVEWWGIQTDMPALYTKAHVVCLPSYREGIPRTLLEGAAMERPLIATDVPGCREVCRDGLNGILVPVRDPQALANAFLQMGGDVALRQRLGKNGRTIITEGFAKDVVERQQLDVYEALVLEMADRPKRTPATNPSTS